MKICIKIMIFLILLTTNVIAEDKSPNNYDMSGSSVGIIKTSSINSILTNNVSERIITTSVIIGELVILFFVLLYWKRTRDDNKSGSENIFKRNIRAIRDEKVNPILDRNKISKRRSLMSSIKLRSVSGKQLTNMAKRLSISKGELFLATRIKQLENQTR